MKKQQTVGKEKYQRVRAHFQFCISRWGNQSESAVYVLGFGFVVSQFANAKKGGDNSSTRQVKPQRQSHSSSLSLSVVIQEQHAPLSCHACGSQQGFKISQETITNDSPESNAVCSCILFALLRLFVVLDSAICNHFLVKYCDQKGSTRHAPALPLVSQSCINKRHPVLLLAMAPRVSNELSFSPCVA